jgi:hypothetical protein
MKCMSVHMDLQCGELVGQLLSVINKKMIRVVQYGSGLNLICTECVSSDHLQALRKQHWRIGVKDVDCAVLRGMVLLSWTVPLVYFILVCSACGNTRETFSSSTVSFKTLGNPLVS